MARSGGFRAGLVNMSLLSAYKNMFSVSVEFEMALPLSKQGKI